jgi:tight adherence protein C
MVLSLTVAAFLIAVGVVLSGYYLMTAESAIEQRLRTVVPDSAGTRAAEKPSDKGPSLMGRLLTGIGALSAGTNEQSLSQLLMTAGYRSPGALLTFVGLRTLVSLGPALAFLIPRVTRGEPLGKTLYLSLLIWAFLHMLCMYLLRRRARRRMFRVQTALPDSLDLMVVCLEAGLGLTATIARVGDERSAMNDPLGEEFTRVARELREGRPREDSLRAMAERNGVEDLKALIGLIVQADRLGASMAKTLRSHADILRTKRRQRAEEAARKLPIKILFPLALFILPALFVVVIGPSILRIGDLITMVSGGH